MVQLHYASIEQLETMEDIKCFNYQSLMSIARKIHQIVSRGPKVLLFAMGDSESSPILIESDVLYIRKAIISQYCYEKEFPKIPCKIDKCFLFEYKSFEEAYAVALSMREISPLCYEPKDEPFTEVHIKGL